MTGLICMGNLFVKIVLCFSDVCTKTEIGSKTRHIKPCFRADFQQSGFERGNS